MSADREFVRANMRDRDGIVHADAGWRPRPYSLVVSFTAGLCGARIPWRSCVRTHQDLTGTDEPVTCTGCADEAAYLYRCGDIAAADRVALLGHP